MSKKVIASVIGTIALTAIIIFSSPFFRGIWPLIKPIPPRDRTTSAPSTTSTPAINTTGIPLTLPSGFSISIFADKLPGARVMVFDSFGNMWVSSPSEGTVSLLEIDKDTGKVTRHGPVFRNLKNPHGLAFDPDNQYVLYIAEEDKISKVTVYSDDTMQKIADLPAGGNHITRTIGFGPDGRLYVSIGSTCNVCHEADDRRAKIFFMNKDGSDFKEYARGLRNTVFFTWHPETHKMWGADMGRDLLGDDVPPDEINIIEEGKNYGWPICYGGNIHDTNFDKNTYIRNPCMEPFETPSFIDVPAHSAPLGLAFVPNKNWPVEYHNDLLLAYHGSWNRSVPTGYKLVRMKFDNQGTYRGTEDFITGWLKNGDVFGRPVDLVFGPDPSNPRGQGNLYVSDDRAGLIYKISYTD